jgi:hypothetical protein
MAKIINLQQKGIGLENDNTLKDDDAQLALLSVFYFIDNFEEKARDLEIDLRYSLAITVYKYLAAAEKYGDLELQQHGFALNSQSAHKLHTLVSDTIKFKSLTFIH